MIDTIVPPPTVPRALPAGRVRVHAAGRRMIALLDWSTAVVSYSPSRTSTQHDDWRTVRPVQVLLHGRFRDKVPVAAPTLGAARHLPAHLPCEALGRCCYACARCTCRDSYLANDSVQLLCAYSRPRSADNLYVSHSPRQSAPSPTSLAAFRRRLRPARRRRLQRVCCDERPFVIRVLSFREPPCPPNPVDRLVALRPAPKLTVSNLNCCAVPAPATAALSPARLRHHRV